MKFFSKIVNAFIFKPQGDGIFDWGSEIDRSLLLKRAQKGGRRSHYVNVPKRKSTKPRREFGEERRGGIVFENYKLRFFLF